MSFPMSFAIRMPRAGRHIRWWLALLVASVVVSIPACGGGGGGVGVGGTGAFASGPISGFASVIVNGIEFDDSAARIEDEDGAASSRGALRLGMTTDIDSGPIGGTAGAPVALATRIRFASELVGPVGSADVAGGALVVFGQAVMVSATTVFDDALTAGLASVTVGSAVTVYGSFDVAANAFVATRVEPAPANLATWRIHAPVHDLDTASRSFGLGAARFGYAGVAAAGVPAGLANGAFVRVRVRVQPVQLGGVWNVIAFGSANAAPPEGATARLRGSVTSFTSTTRFSVDGRAVDAAGASFPNGTAGIVLGARVEAEGATVGGVLQASQVKVDGSGGSPAEIRLQGAIESHQPAQQTFVLRGVTVFYAAPGVRFDKGSSADIAVGVVAEVRGGLSADGTRVLATRIRIGN